MGKQPAEVQTTADDQTRREWVTPVFQELDMKKALSSAPPPYTADLTTGYS